MIVASAHRLDGEILYVHIHYICETKPLGSVQDLYSDNLSFVIKVDYYPVFDFPRFRNEVFFEVDV